MPWPELHAGTNFNYVWDTNTLAWVKETQPSGGSGGTGATIGAAVPATASAVAVKDNAGNLAYPNLDASGNLLVAVTGAGSGGTSSVDGAGYTAGTTAGTPALGAVDDTGTTACAEDKVGIVRITPQRAFHSNLRTQAGVEAGTSGSPLQVSLANTGANATAVKVDNSAVTQPVKLETQLDYDTGAGTVPTSIVGIALPASGGPVAGGTTTNPLNIAAAALPLPTGAATETGNLAAIKADVDKIPSQGQALAAASMPVVLPAAQITTLTPPAAITGFALDATLTGRTAKIQITDGTRDGTVKAASTVAVATDTAVVVAVRDAVVTTPPSNASTNVAQISGTAASVNSGLKDAGTLRVVLATDQPALTNKLLVTPDSVALPANQSVNVAQLAGTTTDVNSGTKSAGTLRVVLATDQPALTNAQPVKTVPQTSGGFTTFHLEAAASTNATVVKASAGQLFGWYIYNNNAAARKVAFHNASTTPTAGAAIFFTIVVPANSAANVFTETGIAFSTGIAITTVTTVPDAGSTAVAVDDLNINLFYA